MTPLVGTGKIGHLIFHKNIKKCYPKKSLVFVIKETVKMRVFLGGCNGKKQIYELKMTVSELWIMNFFWKSNYVSTTNILAVIWKKRKVAAEKNCRPQFGDPSWIPITLHFSAKVTSCKETSSIKKLYSNFKFSSGEVL